MRWNTANKQHSHQQQLHSSPIYTPRQLAHQDPEQPIHLRRSTSKTSASNSSAKQFSLLETQNPLRSIHDEHHRQHPQAGRAFCTTPAIGSSGCSFKIVPCGAASSEVACPLRCGVFAMMMMMMMVVVVSWAALFQCLGCSRGGLCDSPRGIDRTPR